MIDMSLSTLEGDKLLKRLIREDKKTNRNLRNPEQFYKHSKRVSNLSYLVSCAFEHRGIDIDVELTQDSGLLHDIGKIVTTPSDRKKDPDLIFDSIYGAKFLKKMGLYKIADVIRPSFTTYELMKLKSKLFPDIKLDDLIPKTPEQKIVVCADTRISGGGRYVSPNERMRDIRERYGKNSLIVQSLDIGGEERLKSLNYEIERVAGLLI